MKLLHKTIKENSKKALEGNWIIATSVAFIYLSFTIVFSMLDSIIALVMENIGLIDVGKDRMPWLEGASVTLTVYTIIMSVLWFLIITPLRLGVANSFYNLSSGKKGDVSDIFIFFDRISFILKAWVLQIQISIRLIIWAVVCYSLPALLTYIIAGYNMSGVSNLSMGLYFACRASVIISYIFATVMMGVIGCKYLLAHYLIIENKRMSTTWAIKLSCAITKGKLQQIFAFRISFLWLVLPSLLIAPIFYILPLYLTNLGLYSRVLIGNWRVEHPEEIIYGENINDFVEDTVPEYRQLDAY